MGAILDERRSSMTLRRYLEGLLGRGVGGTTLQGPGAPPG